MWMLDYGEAAGYVRDELGCPDRNSFERASSWGADLAAQAKEPALQVLGRAVTAVAETSLGNKSAAMSELDKAAGILAAGQPADLVKGLALSSHDISGLKERLAVSPLLHVCEGTWSSPF